MKKHMLVGRNAELKLLESQYKARGSQIVVVYGRRRVGKSSLIEKFVEDKLHLHFEGLEGLSTVEQIQEFTKDLAKQVNDPLLGKVIFKSWTDVFDYLTP